jgi:hypothetical protein
MIEKQFTPTAAMHFKASREIYHSNKASFAFYAFFIGIPALLLIFYIVTGKGASYEVVPNIPAWLFLLLCAIYALALTLALQYWGIRKSLLSNPSANQAQNYQISEEGIRNYGLGVDVTLGWDKIIKIKKNKKFLLLFISKSVAYFIPVGLVSEREIKEIESWHKQT